MNRPADIICFAKDWHEPKTSNNHVMEALAQRHRVLWVNSIATRNPNLGSANDLKKIFRKLRSWCRGIERIHDNLRVLTPIVLPFPRSRLAQAINRRLLRWRVNATARAWKLQRPQLWIFPPNAVDYVGQFGESLVVYYCVDDWSGFTHLDAAFIRRKEQELLAKAQAVFVVARRLLAGRTGAHLSPHGVDHTRFARALTDAITIPDEIRNLPRPIIGFYGNLYDWVDQPLLAAIAKLRPAWSFVLVGKIMSDISQLRQQPNIHLLGPRPYDDLPRFCKGFAVGLIPYNTRDPRMQTVNPLKLREYLAAGLPVVSVAIPEVEPRPGDVFLAATAEEFVAQIEHALAADTPARKLARSQSMQAESWTARVAAIEQILAATPVAT